MVGNWPRITLIILYGSCSHTQTVLNKENDLLLWDRCTVEDGGNSIEQEKGAIKHLLTNLKATQLSF
jgi:hypothetical protein